MNNKGNGTEGEVAELADRSDSRPLSESELRDLTDRLNHAEGVMDGVTAYRALARGDVDAAKEANERAAEVAKRMLGDLTTRQGKS